MIKTDIYNIQGKISGKVNLPEKLFGAKINAPLLAQAVRVYTANLRRARAKTKTRGEVNKTSAKWFRQKGTGHARHGAKSAPIFVGGGVAHGPTGTQNWKLNLPQKMRGQALSSALTSKFKNKEVVIVDGLEKIEGKTKEVASFLSAHKEKKDKGKASKFLLVLPKKDDKILRAGRNIAGLTISFVNMLNAYEVLRARKILITASALELFKTK